MFSYQHIYHAGSFADVHKHIGLLLMLEALNARPKPYVYFDTHAGRGVYDLASREANKTGEYKHGIKAIALGSTYTSALSRYLKLMETFRAKYGATAYPGSPAIAREMMRAGDRMVLSELHPGELVKLKEAFKKDRVEIYRQDAMNGMIAMVPPSVRRGLVLIDPSYEIKSEYAEIVPKMAKALRRWDSGIFALWYPILKDARHEEMLAGLRAIRCDKMVSEFMAPETIEGHRMLGSGLIVFNPPSKLGTELDAAMDELNNALYGGAGSHTVS
ncbi:23S rRNA (adenine(2030)-N(6))-methyltransferase RlmJ [Kordiimonas marina]|uniref:23S rRNA (adenine(2030)-N(6))-methyltransferase RlmJ n=1 Tax=Kordiimonas marina TaxID=2872312 RepID=UPI001FF5E450|nr:23S rRNA (adenine(2030)-N(6))-methyltransferase RlmJ [Kordiimonas marina]MCJ9429416.1 23S rRNA (adenine(2030)-N(6))-methyltransferase RlmJ [Kordiimonas marina]